MTTQHTPGPWVLDIYGNLKVGHEHVRFSGLCLSSGKEANANTVLAAASPELLEALCHLEMLAGQSAMWDDLVRVAARAAIAKATGKSK